MDYSEWQESWKSLVDKYEKKGYNSLTPDERIWFNIRCLIDAADNGGLISFYYNSGADHLDDTIQNLLALDAKNVVELLNKINQLFPHGQPPHDFEERNEIMSSWDNDRYEELLEELDSKFFSLENGLELKLEMVVKKVMSPGS